VSFRPSPAPSLLLFSLAWHTRVVLLSGSEHSAPTTTAVPPWFFNYFSRPYHDHLRSPVSVNNQSNAVMVVRPENLHSFSCSRQQSSGNHAVSSFFSSFKLLGSIITVHS
jgi:hypothetical protein